MYNWRYKNAEDSLQGLKIHNSRESCGTPLWDNSGMYCIIYTSCGKPCRAPCKLCAVWNGYGAILEEEYKG